MADPGMTKESLTKADLAWGGFWKIKCLVTRADPGVTKELAPRQTPA